jgi:hypothetical protein
MTSRSRSFPLRLWLGSLLAIVAIVVIASLVSGPKPHVGTPVIVRLAAAAIVTGCAAVANSIGGRRAAAATAVVGVLIAVVVLSQPA